MWVSTILACRIGSVHCMNKRYVLNWFSERMNPWSRYIQTRFLAPLSDSDSQRREFQGVGKLATLISQLSHFHICSLLCHGTKSGSDSFKDKVKTVPGCVVTSTKRFFVDVSLDADDVFFQRITALHCWDGSSHRTWNENRMIRPEYIVEAKIAITSSKDLGPERAGGREYPRDEQQFV